MNWRDFLRRIPVFVGAFAVLSLLSPEDPFYLRAGALQPHLWASAILAVWLGLWVTLICSGGLAAAMLLARSRLVDPLEAETLFVLQDWIAPLAIVLVSVAVAYLADRLREAAQVERQKVLAAERALAELGRLNEGVGRARSQLEQELHTLTRTPAQIAGIAERFEVDSQDELLRNLLQVTTEHVRSRAAAIYQYDTFSRWTLVDSRDGSLPAAPGVEAPFAKEVDDSELPAAERDGLRQLLSAGTAPDWRDGKLVRAGDLVLRVRGAEIGGFYGVLIHRGVSFAETSPSVRATIEALARWASLILKRRGKNGSRA